MSISSNELYSFDRFRLEAAKRRLWRDEAPVTVTPKAVELLLLLVERQGQVVEKEFLLTELWPDTVVEESNLTQTMYMLRKALGQTADGQPFIETYSKRGYKFLPAVQRAAPAVEAPVIAKLTQTRIVLREVESETPMESHTTMALPAPPVSQRGWLRPAALVLGGVLLAALGFVLARHTQPAPAPAQALAVLPFKTIGPRGNEAFLGLGMADAIITRLGKTGKLAVSPTAAVRRYLEQETDPRAAGQALQVSMVLTGNVQQQDDRLRLTVQLLQVSDGRQIWAEQFDEKFTDVFAIQDLLTQRLAGALTLRLTSAEQQRLTQARPANLEAYELYLKGRYYWNRRTPEWIRKAIECFEQATRLDPGYAQAYAGLADSYAISVSGLPPLERMPKAKAAAEQALALDETLAEAHASLGFIKYKFDWDWAGAEASFKRALELNPNYATALHWYGEMLSLVGRFDEAVALLQQAERLDPLSLAIKHNLGEAWFRARQYDRVEWKAREMLELDPHAPQPHYLRWHLAQAQGRYEDAVSERLIWLSKSKTEPELLSALQQARAANGRRGYWQKELALAAAGRLRLNSNEQAKHSLYLGDTERAFQLIEQSFAERGDAPLLLKTLPSYDPLRNAPRFQSLLHRVGFPP